MYEFLSKDYGHDIEIISYDDFCEKWWERQDFTIKNASVYYIKYFENNEWHRWNTDNYGNKIYEEYKLFVQKKKNKISME